MTVREIMEKAGINQTGRAISHIKDALDEIAIESPTHIKTIRMDIESSKRFYDFPKEALKILDIRCKDHDNEEGLYESIPRTVYEPDYEDSDGK